MRIIKLFAVNTLLAIFFVVNFVQPLAALSQEQRRVLDSGARYFNVENTPPPTCATANLSGNDNAERIFNFLISKGFQPIQAAGIMGNMKVESGFEPRLVEYSWKNSRGETSVAGQPSSLDDNIPPNQNDKGQPGYGLVQWTSPGRKQGLADLVAKNNVKASDLGTQLEYLMQELQTGYKDSVYTPLLAATTIEEASDIFLEKYEVPGGIETQRPIRRGFARDILTQFGSGVPTSPGVPSGGSCAAQASIDGCPTEPVGASEVTAVAGITVHSCIAQEVERIITLANSQNLNMSGDGWRSKQQQIDLRGEKGCGGEKVYDESCNTNPPTAIPGKSRHERGTAVDFTCNGKIFDTDSHPCYIFLKANTKLKNLPGEQWHWSNDGG